MSLSLLAPYPLLLAVPRARLSPAGQTWNVLLPPPLPLPTALSTLQTKTLHPHKPSDLAKASLNLSQGPYYPGISPWVLAQPHGPTGPDLCQILASLQATSSFLPQDLCIGKFFPSLSFWIQFKLNRKFNRKFIFLLEPNARLDPTTARS